MALARLAQTVYGFSMGFLRVFYGFLRVFLDVSRVFPMVF